MATKRIGVLHHDPETGHVALTGDDVAALLHNAESFPVEEWEHALARSQGIAIEQEPGLLQARKLDDAEMYEVLRNNGMSHGQAVRAVNRRSSGNTKSRLAAGIRDFMRSGTEGATFGFADEFAGIGAALVPGGKGYTEARNESRGNMARIHAEHPVASRVAEVGGAVALPGLGLARGAATGMRAVGAGAASGALYGAGTAEGGIGSRARGASIGGALGAAGGAVVAGATKVVAGARNAVATARTARQPRRLPDNEAIAKHFAKKAIGNEEGEIGKAVQAAKDEVRRVSETSFKSLEKDHSAVTDPVIGKLLKNPDVVAAARDARITLAKDKPPSLTDLQAIRRGLLSRASGAKAKSEPEVARVWRELADQFSGAMESRIPGYAKANAEYRAAKTAEAAFDKGAKMLPKRVEEIRTALRALPSEEARRNFKVGMAARFYDDISQRGGPLTLKQIEKFESLGMRKRLAEMFHDKADFEALMKELKREKMIILSQEQLPKLKAAGWAKIKFAAGLTGGAALAKSLFD